MLMIDLGYATPAPQPPKRRRNARLWILGGGVAVAVAGAVSVASIASAQTPSPSASPSAAAKSAAPSKAPGRLPGMREKPVPFGFGGFGPGFGGALHGEYTTVKPGGGYQTIDIQQGQVTAVSTSSITVKSDDGFSKSYAVTATTLVDAQRDGIGSIKVGDTVSVRATVDGGAATATDIADRSEIRQAHPKPSPSK
jgi:hypothetical protein